MSGDKTKKGGYGLRNNPDREMEKVSANETGLASEQHGDCKLSMDMIRDTMREVMSAEMVPLQAELRKSFMDFRTEICEDLKKQTSELAKELNQKLQETNTRMGAMEDRVQQVEDNMAQAERWDIGVKSTLVQLLQNQQTLKDKVSDLEGREKRNNIRLYGVPEESEGTSMITFVENLIKNELGEILTPDCNVGIERAHRALGPKPPASAPPRSIIVRFLRFTVKEEVLRAAWKKKIHIHGKQVYFDHDYALEVQKRRKEYIPIKKALKEKGIRFQTPLSKMRVFYASGSILYSSASQAAEDLQKRGIAADLVSTATARNNTARTMTEETLAQLFPWEMQPSRRGNFHKSIREKLKEFRRQEDVGE